MERPVIWFWDDSALAFTDYTSYVKQNNPITLNFGEVEDALYIGFSRRFDGYLADLTTNGEYTDLLNQYFSGSWPSLNIITSYNFDESKFCRWNIPPELEDSWSKIQADITVVGGFPNSGASDVPVSIPDSIDRFWIRIKLDTAGSTTTAAIISKFRIFSYAGYTTPELVHSFLQLPTETKFDFDSIPSSFYVEEMIRQAEDEIDHYTHKSWRFNNRIDYLDFNEYGVVPVHHHDVYKVYEVAVWNGSSFDVLTEGRAAEWFADEETGHIFFTRSYTLPSRFRVIRGFWRWDLGEYNRSIRVNYAYGYDKEINRQFKAVQSIATRMVAVDLLENHNFGIFTVEGPDKMSYESKITHWKDEIEKSLDKFAVVVTV